MIELGLARISRLVKNLPMPWKAIHVAGTNGKGSVCSYASAMLSASKVKCGRFTSPHLIDRWDCITIDDKVVDHNLFHQVEEGVRDRDTQEGIGASEFELLTATAFEIFTKERIQIAVVEVGMGGRLDATNVLQDPLVTVITKIGMDHESFLGDSLEAIAAQKAGIIKKGSECIVDGTNSPDVIRVLRDHAVASQSQSFRLVPQDEPLEHEDVLKRAEQIRHLEDHQNINLSLAYKATEIALMSLDHAMESHVLRAALTTSWPGRLQTLDVSDIAGRDLSILLDGAHNASSAQVLASYVDRKLRIDSPSILWILAFSQGKDIKQLLSTLLRPGDKLLVAEFGPVEGMPWVKAASGAEILSTATQVAALDTAIAMSEPPEELLKLAAKTSGSSQIVTAGSLYLVSDILRAMR